MILQGNPACIVSLFAGICFCVHPDGILDTLRRSFFNNAI